MLRLLEFGRECLQHDRPARLTLQTRSTGAHPTLLRFTCSRSCRRQVRRLQGAGRAGPTCSAPTSARAVARVRCRRTIVRFIPIIVPRRRSVRHQFISSAAAHAFPLESVRVRRCTPYGRSNARRVLPATFALAAVSRFSSARARMTYSAEDVLDRTIAPGRPSLLPCKQWIEAGEEHDSDDTTDAALRKPLEDLQTRTRGCARQRSRSATAHLRVAQFNHVFALVVYFSCARRRALAVGLSRRALKAPREAAMRHRSKVATFRRSPSGTNEPHHRLRLEATILRTEQTRTCADTCSQKSNVGDTRSALYCAPLVSRHSG